MSAEEYNGYRNYETWAFKLWIDNEESSYTFWRDQTQSIIRAAQEAGETPNTGDLADMLQESAEESAPDLEASFYSDVLNNAIREVDFYQIAQMMIEDEA